MVGLEGARGFLKGGERKQYFDFFRFRKRYLKESASTMSRALGITSNRAFKDWPEIFNNDSTLTSAILDRLLHHAETVIITSKSAARVLRLLK